MGLTNQEPGARSAGLQTGIARAAGETPPATREEARSQERRSSDRHRPRSGRNSPRHPEKKRGARNAGLQTGIARIAGETPLATQRRSAEPGTPVFRPASPAQRAKLPSPPAKKRGARNAGLQTGIARTVGETPLATREEARSQERRSSDRHRPRSGRNSPRHPEQKRGARNAGLQTGIARTAGETPIATQRRSAEPGTPVFRPASPAQRAKLPPPPAKKRGARNAGLQTGIARTAGETPLATERRSAEPGAPVFRPASPVQRVKLPSPLPRMAQPATRMAPRHARVRTAFRRPRLGPDNRRALEREFRGLRPRCRSEDRRSYAGETPIATHASGWRFAVPG